MNKVLVVPLQTENVQPLQAALAKNFILDVEEDLDLALAKFRQFRYEFVFFDTTILKTMALAGSESIESCLQNLRKSHPAVPIIVCSDQAHLRETISAVHQGATNYLIYPTTPEEVLFVIQQSKSEDILNAELDYFKDQFWDDSVADLVVTKNKAMQDVYNKVKSVAKTSSTVLLTGETGVGKSLVAKLIHEHSIRKAEPFVATHCGAIAETLLESELFGHEKGSFTGAIRRKLGRFEIANRGTIFLDEIGTLSATAQIKLLQVLQDSLFQRVGGESDIKVDVRVIAATNENLKDLSDSKMFRSDLFFRLNVFPIHIPPLRERLEDIPLLCSKFILSLNHKYPKRITEMSPNALEVLTAYNWPGNIRELENVIERAYIVESANVITPESLPQELLQKSDSSAVFVMDVTRPLAEIRNQVVEDVERQYLKELLSKKMGKINETAKVAGLGVRQINKLMLKYGLKKDQFKNRS